MKRISFNVRLTVSDVRPVSGYAFGAFGLRFGVSDDGAIYGAGRLPFWTVYELTSGGAVGTVRKVSDLGAFLVKLADSGRLEYARGLDKFLSNVNPGLIPARVLYFAHNFKRAGVTE